MVDSKPEKLSLKSGELLRRGNRSFAFVPADVNRRDGKENEPLVVSS